MRQIGIAGILGALLVALAAGSVEAPYHTASTPPAGGAFAAQAKTAAAHASYAAEGSTVTYVREHLEHALLCIEGPKGKNVNAAWENPCAGQGGGVLRDLGAGGGSWRPVAEAADGLAVAGLRAHSLPTMKAAARGTAALMTLIAGAK